MSGDATCPRAPDPLGRLRRHPCRDGAVGMAVAATTSGDRPGPSLAQQSGHCRSQHRGCPPSLPGRRRRHGAARRGPRLGTFPGARSAALAAIAASVILLDLAIYFQHVLFHAVPVLWRLHRMHHADLEFDVTTGCASILSKSCCRWGSSSGSSRRSERRPWRCWSSRCCSTPPRCSTTAMSGCRRRSTACCAGSWSRRRCTGSTIRSCRARPTAISASTCLGGIGCSAPIAPSRRPGTKV